MQDKEKPFTRDLAGLLRKEVDFSNATLKGLLLKSPAKILYDISSLFPASGVFEPRFGFLEQDIVIGKLLRVQNGLGKYFYKVRNKSEILQPEIVLEIKYGDVISHQLITYSTIADRMKSIFPRCKYYLVLGYASVNIFNKVMRHGTHFDRVIHICSRTIRQKKIPNYTKGKLIKDLQSNEDYRANFYFLVQQIQKDLSTLKINW